MGEIGSEGAFIAATRYQRYRAPPENRLFRRRLPCMSTTIIKGQPVMTSFNIQSFEDIEKSHWDSVFRRSATKNLFYDHTLIKAAMAAWSDCRPDGVVTGYDRDNQLVFLQPFREKTSLLGKTVEFLRIPTADSIEPLVAAENREAVLAAFPNFLRKTLKPDLLIAKSLTQEFYSFLCEHFSTDSLRINGTGIGTILYLPGTLEEFLARYKSSFRNQLKRKVKKGLNAGLSFRLVNSRNLPDKYDLTRALKNHTRLHEMRFNSINKDSFFLKSDFQKFHQYLCKNHEDPAFMLTFTEALHDNNVVGSMYGIQTPSIYIYLMLGFDPKYAPLSVGNLMIYHTIQGLITDQVKAFDFKVGDEPYKKRWTKSEYTKHHISIRFSPRGRLLSWQELGRTFGQRLKRVPGKLRRMLWSKTESGK
jgi:CelD/BcsL family acetyltransferase involved in cellulose biosynthesis